jgi:hypothetical protein
VTTTNPYNASSLWFRMQLGKLGLGETGFFEGTKKAEIRVHSHNNFFAIREVEKKNGA